MTLSAQVGSNAGYAYAQSIGSIPCTDYKYAYISNVHVSNGGSYEISIPINQQVDVSTIDYITYYLNAYDDTGTGWSENSKTYFTIKLYN